MRLAERSTGQLETEGSPPALVSGSDESFRPTFRSPSFAPPRPPSRSIRDTPRRQFAIPSTRATSHAATSPAPTAAPSAQRRPNELVGTIIQVNRLNPEPPDPNVPRILLSVLLTLDLIVILGSIIIWFLVAVVVLALLAAFLNARWLLTLLGFLFQTIFFFLSPLLRTARNRNDEQLVPVTNYIVRAADNKAYRFRIKGQLAGATPEKGDRIRVWGRPRHGILRFSGGENLDDSVPYVLPRNWAWLLLLFALLVNLAAYLWARGTTGF